MLLRNVGSLSTDYTDVISQAIKLFKYIEFSEVSVGEIKVHLIYDNLTEENSSVNIFKFLTGV
jgi:hypothetical protein